MRIVEFSPPNLPSAEDQFRDIESSGLRDYRNDPLFHAQVHLGAKVINHAFPEIEWPDAQRCALLVLAASRRAPL